MVTRRRFRRAERTAHPRGGRHTSAVAVEEANQTTCKQHVQTACTNRVYNPHVQTAYTNRIYEPHTQTACAHRVYKQQTRTTQFPLWEYLSFLFLSCYVPERRNEWSDKGECGYTEIKNDFVGLTTRTPHRAYVREANRNRGKCHQPFIERLLLRTPRWRTCRRLT